MLVLSRKLNEKIVIDGGIVITVVKIEGGQVRIGIEAPASVKVFREEIAKSRRESTQSALVASGV
jgi:carbon storage regulator